MDRIAGLVADRNVSVDAERLVRQIGWEALIDAKLLEVPFVIVLNAVEICLGFVAKHESAPIDTASRLVPSAILRNIVAPQMCATSRRRNQACAAQLTVRLSSMTSR
jgi:hypothetical protein